MARKRDWAKLDEDWMGNRKVRKVVRKFGPAAGAYWAMLIARSYADSHHEDNPLGVVTCSVQDLADLLSDHHDRASMWEAMIAAGLVRIVGGDWRQDPEADVSITLVDFAEWQHPKGSGARRSAEKRDRDKTRDLQVSVTTPNHAGTTPHADLDREREREREEEIQSSSSPSPPAREPAPACEADDDDDDQTQGQTRKTATLARWRHDCGSTAFAADDLADHYRGLKPGASDGALVTAVYQPVYALLQRYDRHIVEDGIVRTIAGAGNAKGLRAYLDTVVTNLAKDAAASREVAAHRELTGKTAEAAGVRDWKAEIQQERERTAKAVAEWHAGGQA